MCVCAHVYACMCACVHACAHVCLIDVIFSVCAGPRTVGPQERSVHPTETERHHTIVSPTIPPGRSFYRQLYKPVDAKTNP